MSNAAIQTALDHIYASIGNDNEDLDQHIAALKQAMGKEKTVIVDPARLAENNRSGRRHMQSYFKKRGVIVEFS